MTTEYIGSFMSVINTFDECSKKDLPQEYKEYCEAMKKIFIGIEQANIALNKSFNNTFGNEEILN